MPLPVPNLDDRRFQDLVNEARERIPQFCPEWTDHNVSDPGIAMIELFAWMTEVLIYRVNQVPDKNHLKFLDLVGIKLKPAVPAQVDITFILTAPQDSMISIPPGTEVATVRTETEESIIFGTETSVDIAPPEMRNFLITRDESEYSDRVQSLRDWADMRAMGVDPGLQGDADSFPLFNQVPEPGNTFYIGYQNDLTGTVLAIDLGCVEAEGAGVNPSNPPIIWQYWDKFDVCWMNFTRVSTNPAWIESDGTRGLNTPGRVTLHIPLTSGPTTVNGLEGFWIRCQTTDSGDRQGQYVSSPQTRSVLSQSIGGMAPATNITRSRNEVLGNSNGRPGQSFRVFHSPMLPLRPGETVEVQGKNDEGWQEWQLVEDFSASSPDSKHFTCDPSFSEIQFGPSVRSAGGLENFHGASPDRDAQIRLTSYRFGGGPLGNVGKGALTVLKSSIPYVSNVTNRQPARGGLSPESIEQAKLRAPQEFKSRGRAVTKEDFEFLALESSTSIAKAHCTQAIATAGPEPSIGNVIQLLLVTQEASESLRPSLSDLAVSQHTIRQVTAFIDDRRLIGTSFQVSEAEYVSVSIEAVVKLRGGSDFDIARESIQEGLYNYIHPTRGGSDQSGWAFGKNLYVSELISKIQQTSEVEYTMEINAFIVDEQTGNRTGPLQEVEVRPTSTLRSETHIISCL
jgi:predicted phage baseplate assembly protein